MTGIKFNRQFLIWVFYQVIFFAAVCIFFLQVAQAGQRRSGVVCRVETDRAVLPAGNAQEVVLKITLDAPPAPQNIDRPPVNLSLVLDRSGSMGGNKIKQAKAAAVEALRRLGMGDIFSVVVYDSVVQTIVPAGRPFDMPGIIRAINRIQPGGSTALFGGVSQGASEIRKHVEEDFVHRIVLLSDGLANIGPRTPAELGRLGAALIKENISVTTVGVGTDYNEDLMARLAQKSDGNTYFVESGIDLPAIFAAELGDVLNVVAKQVKVTVTLPDSVNAMEIIGREGLIRGNRVELSMNQLYGGQEKYALIRVRVPGLNPGTDIQVARAEVNYENPFTGKDELTSGDAWAAYSADPKKVARSTNVDVVKEYQLNLNALAQEKAIELSDKGKKKEAVRELKQSAAMLKKIGAQYEDEELLEEAQAIESQADMIEEKGMSKKSRKILRTKSYQQKYQQKSQ